MMIKFEVNHDLGTGNIWIDSDGINTPESIQYDPVLSFYFRQLRLRHGTRGILGDRSTPLDLYKAIDESGFKYKIIEGSEILEQNKELDENGKIY